MADADNGSLRFPLHARAEDRPGRQVRRQCRGRPRCRTPSGKSNIPSVRYNGAVEAGERMRDPHPGGGRRGPAAGRRLPHVLGHVGRLPARLHHRRAPRLSLAGTPHSCWPRALGTKRRDIKNSGSVTPAHGWQGHYFQDTQSAGLRG
ncbi:hypothetical protein HF086_000108 [Spodoptera exigua]|uniref:Uncharacterized protein n=1 Tax=Spodoptera exigua TaxID=7107 RepID=A0A922MPC7_SPOEX|nr:hypothetical protein HF086_000108 [Spodoptera exigua]